MSENCSVSKQMQEGNELGCSVAKANRDTLYSGNDMPRLWTGEEERKQPNIDVASINQPNRRKSDGRAIVGYVGTLRVDYSYEAGSVANDIANARSAGATKFDPDEKVTVNFNHATLDFFLKQMLGGALGVNYFAGEDLGGSITFKTEEPIPKSQVLQVVRDILGRNGLQIRFQNGVYQIGRADSMAALDVSSNAGRIDDQDMRLVNVGKGNAAEVINIARQLVPQNVVLQPSGAGDAVIVRAPSSDLNSVADMVNFLAKNGAGVDRIAILHLRQAAPDRVAAELNELYGARLGSPGGARGGGGNAGQSGPAPITIIPLDNQQALLVASRDPRLLDGAKELVTQLDQSGVEEQTLRIIPLSYLSADEIVPHLNAIFTGGKSAAQTSPGGPTSPQSNGSLSASAQSGAPATAADLNGVVKALVPTLPAPTALPNVSLGDGESGGNVSLPYGSLTASSAGKINSASTGRAAPSDAGTGGLALTAAFRIEADTRNNSIMIYSNYSTFKRVREILKALDVPQAQVVIEATIVEVDLTDNLQYGVQWYLQSQGLSARISSGAPPITDPGTAGGYANIGPTIGTVQANVVLSALQSITTTKVISAPYLTVLDRKPARLVIGNQIPYTQTQQSTTLSGTTTVTQQIQIEDTGIILDVTPKINANNSVLLTIDQQVTTPSSSALAGNDLTPVIAKREVKSDIVVQSGRTILLGGMMQERVDKTENALPGVRNIPVLGDLFKTKSDQASRVELLIMITPRVARQSSQIENITRQLRDQLHAR